MLMWFPFFFKLKYLVLDLVDCRKAAILIPYMSGKLNLFLRFRFALEEIKGNYIHDEMILEMSIYVLDPGMRSF